MPPSDSCLRATSLIAKEKAGLPGFGRNSPRFEPRMKIHFPKLPPALRVSASSRLFLHLLLYCLAPALSVSSAGTRVKDLVMVAGARDNQLVGYGLVAGLVGNG